MAVLVVLLTDQHAEDRDKEDSRRVQHPYDHRVLNIKRTGTHQMGEQADREKSERTLIALALESCRRDILDIAGQLHAICH